MLNAEEILDSLRAVIPNKPCWLVIHSSLLKLGINQEQSKWPFVSAINSLVKEGYTLALPSFTFSFTDTGEFDARYTPSETGNFSNWAMESRYAARTSHPIYSHVVLGTEVKKALACSTETCFGKKSIFSLFARENACLVMFGCDWKFCTSFHYFEEEFDVPYRYPKRFYHQNKKSGFTEMFVRNHDFVPKNNFSAAVEKMRTGRKITSSTLRGAKIESCRFVDLSLTCRTLLENDIFSFLDNSVQVEKLINDDKASKESTIRIGVFGDSNLDILVSNLREICSDVMPDCGIKIYSPGFGQMYSDLLNGKIEGESLDYAFLANRIEDLYQTSSLDLIDFDNLAPIHRYLDFIQSVGQLISRKVYINRFYTTGSQNNGFMDFDGLDSTNSFIDNANRLLANEIEQSSNLHLLSPAAMTQGKLGSDPRLWFLGRLPFSDSVTKRLAKSYCSIIAHDTGKTARLLVLDLDNTLWGGVVGEDGIEGLSLGGDYPGNAFRDFQAALLKLKQRGLALAIVSKNDEGVALEAIEKHSEMILKGSDFATYRINWNEKFQNIIEICEELSLGPKNVLFIDDNPVERAKVIANLPDVRVVDMPGDPALYKDALLNDPALGISNFSKEDLTRARGYENLVANKRARKAFNNIEDFYMSLGMRVFLLDVNESNKSRVLQLFAKTNQFNTTTIRYSDQQLEAMVSSREFIVKVIGYKDDTSEFENIGVFVATIKSNSLVIENFLMSCRVLERGIEKAVLSWISKIALTSGLAAVKGRIIETPRNSPARDLFKKCGFISVDKNEEWSAQPEQISSCPSWIMLSEDEL
tara:strand:- start:1635 stop:4073 length:2439 start_codon:yes stop_codon:yes gene_type:complete